MRKQTDEIGAQHKTVLYKDPSQTDQLTNTRDVNTPYIEQGSRDSALLNATEEVPRTISHGSILRTAFNSHHKYSYDRPKVFLENVNEEETHPRYRALEIRLACRAKQITAMTCNLPNLNGHVQVNVVILPEKYAFSFLLFCLKNPQGCPLIDVIRPGEQSIFARELNICTDMPRYWVYRDGVKCEELLEITDLWEDDFVTFLLGCSFSWEDLLSSQNLCPRHVAEGKNVPMYRCLSRKNNVVEQFAGNLVVSMRPYGEAAIQKVVDITKKYPGAHGAPIHIGDPGDLGIRDLKKPDFGDSISIGEDDIPMFWACGITTQEGLTSAKLPIAITHAPGHMLVLDLFNNELEV